jgi:hypothetical protein
MGEQDHHLEAWNEILTHWVLDPNVKSFLESEGIELIIVLDEKFLSETPIKPLIILRGMKSSSDCIQAKENIFDKWELLE